MDDQARHPDRYQAMISDQPHGRALSRVRAVEEIAQHGAGSVGTPPGARVTDPGSTSPPACEFAGEKIRDVAMVVAPADRPRRTLLATGGPIAGAEGRHRERVVALRELTGPVRTEGWCS